MTSKFIQDDWNVLLNLFTVYSPYDFAELRGFFGEENFDVVIDEIQELNHLHEDVYSQMVKGNPMLKFTKLPIQQPVNPLEEEEVAYSFRYA